MRRGGARCCLSGARDPGRLRRAVSQLRSRLLRLLRADGEPQYGLANQPASNPRPKRPADRAVISQLQRLGVAIPQRQRGVRARMRRGGKTIRVEYLARVEGEGAPHIKLKGDQVQDVQRKIFEPPRLFEAFPLCASIDE